MITKVVAWSKTAFETAGGVALGLLLIAIVFGLAFGIDCLIVWLCMALWNSCAVAAVSVLSPVGFWQMWGIYLLALLLVKGSTTVTSNSDNR
jgi:hypothetical protein